METIKIRKRKTFRILKIRLGKNENDNADMQKKILKIKHKNKEKVV